VVFSPVAVPRAPFADILRRIERLRSQAAATGMRIGINHDEPAGEVRP
jgi:hypothetical protein